jgi:hypothetical protein
MGMYKIGKIDNYDLYAITSLTLVSIEELNQENLASRTESFIRNLLEKEPQLL